MNQTLQDDLKQLYHLKDNNLSSTCMDYLPEERKNFDNSKVILTDILSCIKTDFIFNRPYLIPIKKNKEKKKRKALSKKQSYLKNIIDRELNKSLNINQSSYPCDIFLPPPSPSLSNDSGIDLSQDLLSMYHSVESDYTIPSNNNTNLQTMDKISLQYNSNLDHNNFNLKQKTVNESILLDEIPVKIPKPSVFINSNQQTIDVNMKHGANLKPLLTLLETEIPIVFANIKKVDFEELHKNAYRSSSSISDKPLLRINNNMQNVVDKSLLKTVCCKCNLKSILKAKEVPILLEHEKKKLIKHRRDKNIIHCKSRKRNIHRNNTPSSKLDKDEPDVSLIINNIVDFDSFHGIPNTLKESIDLTNDNLNIHDNLDNVNINSNSIALVENNISRKTVSDIESADDLQVVSYEIPAECAIRSTLMIVEDENETLPSCFLNNTLNDRRNVRSTDINNQSENTNDSSSSDSIPLNIVSKRLKINNLKKFSIELLRSTSLGLLEDL